MNVSDITKEATIITESATFYDALKKMVQAQTNTLLVIDENGELAGEVSVSDLLDAIVPEHLDGDSIVSKFATEELFAAAVSDLSLIHI